MCGIAGLIDPHRSRETRAAAVVRMCDAMVYRGPDDSGLEESADATLGMSRLAIIDPANGHQPMRSPDGRFTLVFNGAIYNYRDPPTELALGGWAFRTHCDTESAARRLRPARRRCLSRLRGMFAFAIWDDREQTLFAARDPLGIKPLYYARLPDSVFASELNALLASGAVFREIDPALRRRIPRLVQRAGPAHYLSRHRQPAAGPLPTWRRPRQYSRLVAPSRN
jgi:asparagine synthase (glutamine-hydrolysing)